MEERISIDIKKSYLEHLNLLKQIIPNAKGEEIKENGEMVEALIDSFIAFIKEQAGHDDEHVHGEHCNHDH